MATYRVILTGAREGLEASRVAPQLALLCKVPVEGAMALLANRRMVIKRALNAETAATYKAALQQVGCKVVIEEETDAGHTDGANAFSLAEDHSRTSLKLSGIRGQVDALAEQVRDAVARLTNSAQRYAARALRQVTPSAAGRRGGLEPVAAAAARSENPVARSPAPALMVRKFLRPYALIIGGVALAAVAVAGTFFTSAPSSDGRCQGDPAAWTNCVGEVKFPNGERYVGQLKDGQPHGRGTFIWPNGEKYVGEWRDGQRNGHGRFFWRDGAKYDGEFRNNKKHGHGTLTYANGRQYVGEFKDGQPVNQPGSGPKAEGRTQKAE